MKLNAAIVALVLLAIFGVHALSTAQSTAVAHDTISTGLVARGVLAPGSDVPAKDALKFTLTVFWASLVALTVFWAVVVIVFAQGKELDRLIDLTKSGLVLKLVTVVAIVAIIFILGLVGRLTAESVTTLLASIAGYVLGESSGKNQSAKPANPSGATTSISTGVS